MSESSIKKTVSPAIKAMLVIFIMLSVFFLLEKKFLIQHNIDGNVVLVGNLILFALGIFTSSRSNAAIDDPNPHKFVRVYYAGFLIRLVVCAAAAGIYIYANNGKVNKMALFICLAIYMLYSVVEVSSLKRKLSEKKNNG